MSLTSRRTVMARKRYKPEEIVAKLRQVDVLLSQGQNIVDAIRQIGVSEVTYYRAPGFRRAENRAGEAPEGPWAREQPAAQGGFRSDAGQAHSAGGCSGKLLSPARRRACLSKAERSCMSPSVAPANARSRAVVTTSSVSPPILSSLPGNTAAMATARSPRSCARRAR